MHLTQIRLLVTDFAGCAAWYRDVLGLTPQFDPPRPPYAAFKPDQGSALSLHERADLGARLGLELGEPGGDRALVSLRVDDLAGYLASVRARGGQVLSGPVDFDGRLRAAYLRDPEGNLVEIQQWLTTREGGPVPPAG